MQSEEAAERDKWNEGCYKVRRQLSFPPAAPTMVSRFRACHVSLPGREAGIAHRPLTRLLRTQLGTMLYRAPGTLPVSFTVSPARSAVPGSARRSARREQLFPVSAGRGLLCLIPSRHPRLQIPEVEPTAAGLTTKSQTVQEMALTGGCGGRGGQNLAVPPGTGLRPASKEPAPAPPAPTPKPRGSGSPGRVRRRGCPAGSGVRTHRETSATKPAQLRAGALRKVSPHCPKLPPTPPKMAAGARPPLRAGGGRRGAAGRPGRAASPHPLTSSTARYRGPPLIVSARTRRPSPGAPRGLRLPKPGLGGSEAWPLLLPR